MSDGRPVIALTMGDPGGCGPELSAKLLYDPGIYDISRPAALTGVLSVMEPSTFLIQDCKTAGHSADAECLPQMGRRLSFL